MAVVNPFIAPLLSPASHRSPFTPLEEGPRGELVLEDISTFRAEGHESTRHKQLGFASKELELRHTKSTESLNTLLNSLPDVVIPEPLCNPLPLQCLAASALPRAIREEIDRVLDLYSTMDKQLQPSEETCSPVLTGAELDGEASRGDQVGVEPGGVESEWTPNGSRETCATSPPPNEVRGCRCEGL